MEDAQDLTGANETLEFLFFGRNHLAGPILFCKFVHPLSMCIVELQLQPPSFADCTRRARRQATAKIMWPVDSYNDSMMRVGNIGVNPLSRVLFNEFEVFSCRVVLCWR